MIKTGYEIIGMMKEGKAPKKIKDTVGDIWEIYKDDNFVNYENKSQDNCGWLFGNSFVAELGLEFEIIEESKLWKPSDDEEYYYLENNGYANKEFKNKDTFGGRSKILLNQRYQLGNCFRTEEEAKKTREKIEIYMRLKRYAEEHNADNIDWNNNKEKKWFISYDGNGFELRFRTYSKDISQVYFASKELCEQAIKEIGEENIKKLFEE